MTDNQTSTRNAFRRALETACDTVEEQTGLRPEAYVSDFPSFAPFVLIRITIYFYPYSQSVIDVV